MSATPLRAVRVLDAVAVTSTESFVEFELSQPSQGIEIQVLTAPSNPSNGTNIMLQVTLDGVHYSDLSGLGPGRAALSGILPTKFRLRLSTQASGDTDAVTLWLMFRPA